jgi:hypothetical protein
MSYSIGSRTVTRGLTLYYDAANTKSYIGSGASWADLSGNNSTLQLYNTPTFITSSGGAITFNGTDEYGATGNVLDNPTNLTVMCWVRWTAGSSYRTIVSKMDNINSGAGWGFFVLSSAGLSITHGLTFLTQENGGNNWQQKIGTVQNLNDNVWRHLTVTLSGGPMGTMSMYINGVSQTMTDVSNGSFSSSSTSTNVYVGCTGNLTTYFAGDIALTQVHSVCLAPTEILQCYNATKGRFGL